MAHPNTKTWVRNLDRHPKAFWLPGFRQRFYPDFVALLHDGRYAVIEHKMGKMESDPDEQAKLDAGRLWEGRSNGGCVFVWVTEDNQEAEVNARLTVRAARA